jgi:hypothetical protein
MSDRVTLVQGSRITEATRAGIPEERIAAIVDCSVKQLRDYVAFTQEFHAEEAAWTAKLAAEKEKLKEKKP